MQGPQLHLGPGHLLVNLSSHKDILVVFNELG